MSSEWADCTLGDFVRLQRGHDLTASEQRSGTVPVMGSAGQNGTHSEAKARGPGVVIGRSGASMGRAHFSEVDYWPHNTCLYVTDFLGNNPRFAYYLLKTLDLATFNSGSAQPSLNRNLIYSMPIQVPARHKQDCIVELLRAFDDRIALLRETNATLEAIAQALFKSWFVDFDPVRAKMEGRVPEGMDEATVALFPDGFEESQLGLVPRGWPSGKLSDYISESTRRVGGKPAQVLSAVQTGHLIKSEEYFTKRVHSEDISKYKLVRPLAFAYNPSRINIGSIGVNEFGELGAVSPIYIVMEPKTSAAAYYLWHHLRTNKFRELIKTMASGTVRQSLSYKDFSSISLVLPSELVLEAFYGFRCKLYLGYKSNLERIDTLTEIRDLLIPRLISGQLRLPEAEALFEEACA